MKIEPVDLEALKREQKPWNLNLVMSVLTELYGREHDLQLDFTLTPKEPEK